MHSSSATTPPWPMCPLPSPSSRWTGGCCTRCVVETACVLGVRCLGIALDCVPLAGLCLDWTLITGSLSVGLRRPLENRPLLIVGATRTHAERQVSSIHGLRNGGIQSLKSTSVCACRTASRRPIWASRWAIPGSEKAAPPIFAAPTTRFESSSCLSRKCWTTCGRRWRGVW